MTEKDTDQGFETEQIEPVGVVEVPTQHLEKVAAYVSSLMSEEADVSGYAFSTVSAGDVGGGDALFGRKGPIIYTGCVDTTDVGDRICADRNK